MNEKLEELERRVSKLEQKEKVRRTFSIVKSILSLLLLFGVCLLYVYLLKNYTNFLV